MGKSQKPLPFIIVFVIAVFILSLSQISSNEFRIKILNIFRLPLKATSGLYYILRDASNFNEVRKENKILKQNVANLKVSLIELQEASLESKRLRELMAFRESEKRKVIPSMVIARDLSRLKDTIVIDKGKKHNVEKDMVVISGNGLVGRVRECGFSISRVLLITDTDSVVSGIVQRTRDEGAVTGNKEKSLIMKYLELDSDVAKGDNVITSGFGRVFEKGISIGHVVSIEKDESGLYLYAIIEPEVDMMKLEEVLVIQ